MKTLRSIQLLFMAGALSQVAAAAGDPLDQWHEVQITGSIPNHVIRYAQGKWLGLKRDETTGASSLVVSTNGRDWSVHTAFDSSEIVTDLDFADGLWLAVGTRQSTNALVLTSTNAVDWNSITLPRGAGPLTEFWRIQRTAQEWVLLGGAGQGFLTSEDGRTWTASPSPRGSPPTGWIEHIVYGDGHWVAVVGGPCEECYQGFFSSTNLTDWQWWRPWPLDYNQRFYDLKFAHGLWFGVVGAYWDQSGGGATLIMTSTDGTNWTPRYSRPGLLGIALNDSRLVTLPAIPAGGGIINTSPPPVLPIFKSAPLISLEQKQPGELIINRAAGIPVAVESTDDLRQWHTLTNLPLGQAVQPFTDPTASSLPARFYRARTP